MSAEAEMGYSPDDAAHIGRILDARHAEWAKQDAIESWKRHAPAYRAILAEIETEVSGRMDAINPAAIGRDVLAYLVEEIVGNTLVKRLPGELRGNLGRAERAGIEPARGASVWQELTPILDKYRAQLGAKPDQPAKPRSEADANRNPG